MRTIWRALVLAGLFAVANAAYAAAVLENGGFELGNFENGPEDWVSSLFSEGAANEWPIGNMSAARSGIQNAGTPCKDSEMLCLDPVSGARLWQDLETHPGDRYLLGFWLGNTNNTESALNVYWGDALVLALRNEVMRDEYFQIAYEYFEVEVKATTFGTRLMFTGFNNQAMLLLDDVSLTVLKAVPVPEPGTLALLSLGLAGLAFARRRKQQLIK